MSLFHSLTTKDKLLPLQALEGAGDDSSEPRKRWRSTGIRVGLVNNMPDSALARTERQFASLLEAAGYGTRIVMEHYALEPVPRMEQARRHIAATYEPIRRLWSDPPDALIITGAEPRELDLRAEPYWEALTQLFEHAERCRIPAMLSCLAAHAAVLHGDGVQRRAVDRKCFGLFRHDVASDHPLMHGAGDEIWLPHTRWNRVDEAALVAAGYTVLARSAAVGVGMFSRHRGSLWLLCQCHPEYDEANLLREYRRDVQRFLLGERADYPELPEFYFEPADTSALQDFERYARGGRGPRAMEHFPLLPGGGRARRSWRQAAVRIFANWLNHVAAPNPASPAGAEGARRAR